MKTTLKQLIPYSRSLSLRWIISRLGLTFLLFLIIWFLISNIFFSNYHENWKDEGYTVINIYDGDTIEVQGKFQPFKVRYIGIDTPETEKPNQKGECFATEALEQNRSLLRNQKVYLEQDKENKDKFERELRYVYIKSNNELRMINFELIREGFGKSLKIEPNTKYYSEIRALEQDAKKKKLGLWGRC